MTHVLEFHLNINHFLKLLYKHRLLLAILLMIVVVGIYFRFINLFNFSAFFGDSGRDVLVAKHIATYKENFLVAPDANGGMGVLNNSPIYYWLIAIPWLISGSEKGVILFFCLIGTSNIILAFILSKQISNNKLALIFPYFVAISNVFIVFSKNVWQPHLLPFVQMISIIFLIKGIKNNKKFLFWSVQFSFFATHIHLSYLPLLFITVLFIGIYFLKIKKYKNFFKLLLLAFFNTILWLKLSKSLVSLNNRESFELIINPFVSMSQFLIFVKNTYLNMQTMSESIFVGYFSKYLYFFILPILLVFLKKIIQGSFGVEKKIAWVIFTMLGSIFLLGSYFKPLHFHYLIPYYLLFWLCFSFIISKVNKNKYIVVIPLIVFATYHLSRGNNYLIARKHISEIETNKIIADIILNKSHNPIIKVCLDDGFHCSNADSFTGSIWYFLEEISGEKFVEIANVGNGNNLIPPTSVLEIEDNFIICAYSTKDCLADLGVEMSEVSILYSENNISLSHYKSTQ